MLCSFRLLRLLCSHCCSRGCFLPCTSLCSVCMSGNYLRLRLWRMCIKTVLDVLAVACLEAGRAFRTSAVAPYRKRYCFAGAPISNRTRIMHKLCRENTLNFKNALSLRLKAPCSIEPFRNYQRTFLEIQFHGEKI